jgi:2-oxo-4-hydroxy-4-carboxy-5-ureidoimidazoline decarboxylase
MTSSPESSAAAPSAQPFDHDGDARRGGLGWFNDLPPAAAHAELLALCRAPGWARQVADGRPYQSVEAALRRSDAVAAALSTDELARALAGHPRIGDRSATGTSRHEQAGVAGADETVLQALADGNAAYEQRFGHIYLACATGRSGPELLALLRERLDNSFAKEWLVVSAELAAINRIRLHGLLAGRS